MVDRYVREIRSCLEGGNYFCALALALTLPDVCGNAAYPNGRVAERYIAWYDEFVGSGLRAERGFEEVAYLSGEIVYNLRNQFLHQGSVSLETSKIREEGNRVDRFTLLLGDGTKLHSWGLTLNVADVWCRYIMVDVTRLCELIADAAARYFAHNRDKFQMTVDVITQERLFEGEGDAGPSDGGPLSDVLYRKLLESDLVAQVDDGDALADALARTVFPAFVEAVRAELEKHGVDKR